MLYRVEVFSELSSLFIKFKNSVIKILIQNLKHLLTLKSIERFFVYCSNLPTIPEEQTN